MGTGSNANLHRASVSPQGINANILKNMSMADLKNSKDTNELGSGINRGSQMFDVRASLNLGPTTASMHSPSKQVLQAYGS